MEQGQQDPQVANTQDTSEAFGAPTGTESSLTSIEDAFFVNTREEAPEEGTPQQETTEAPVQQPQGEEPYQAKNDDKRFEYWQSQADKANAQLAEQQKQMEQMQSQMNQVQAQPQQAQAPKEEFPPAPEKPKRPSRFSRNEAYEDPDSPSARFLDELDEWRDNMNEYNQIRSQYDTAILQEKFDAMQQERVKEAQRQQAAQEQNKQIQQVRELVTGHHGLTPEQADDFINKMSDPNSVSMDNLVKLYLMEQGQGNPQTGTTPQPSEAFQQTQRAQQVPSPMGTMPSSGNQPTQSDEDQIMDSMIGNWKSKNPW